MNYHIQTNPIWEAYAADGCPVCKLEKKQEDALIKYYLSDAVMEPDFRIKSNKRGFCLRHAQMLSEKDGKLPFALTLETRIGHLKVKMQTPKNGKAARKLADAVQSECGCAICDELRAFMPRYYMTIAQMYCGEKEFPARFNASTLCFEHALELLRYSDSAGAAQHSYAEKIIAIIRKAMNEKERTLKAFADSFDYRNAGTTPPKGAISDALTLLYGEKFPKK